MTEFRVPQLGTNVDVAGDHIHCDTFLRTGPGDQMCRRLTDVLLSRIVEIGVILAWHGFWSATGKINSVFVFFA